MFVRARRVFSIFMKRKSLFGSLARSEDWGNYSICAHPVSLEYLCLGRMRCVCGGEVTQQDRSV
jgi:hypothetical protein